MRKKWLLLISVCYCNMLAAQNDTTASFEINKKYSVLQLKEDLKVLKDSLEILHPALYRYCPRSSFNTALTSAYKQADKSLTLSEFYGVVAPLISKVGDIHTITELPDEYTNYLVTNGDLFPFDVRIINKKAFIASNNSLDSTIPVGSKILAINGQSVETVLAKMESYFSSEGANKTLKVKRTEQRFAFHYHFVYGYSKEFKLQYSINDKLTETRIVSAIPFSTIRVNRQKNALLFSGLKSLFAKPPYLLLSLDKKKETAVLTIKWFQNDVLIEDGSAFKPFIDSAFSEINKYGIKNLVIDIRNNGGGESENAAYLYSWLTNKPFRFLYYIETNKLTYEQDKKLNVQYSYFGASQKYRTSDSVLSSPYQQFFGLNIQQPHPNNFSGRVYVIIDGLTTSAAPQFAALVKQNNRGALIGEEAPGALNGGSGRGYAYFFLPNTGLLIMISKYRLGMVSPEKKSKEICVQPDYKTRYTIMDLLNGVDKDIEYALSLIDGGN